MDDSTSQEKLNYRLLDSLAQQTPTVLVGHLVVGAVSVGLFWAKISPTFVLGWIIFVLFTLTVRWFIRARYERYSRRRSPSFWRAWFAVTSVMLGMMWCVWNLYVGLAIEYSGAALSILVITAAGLGSGAVASTSSSLLSYFLFTGPTILPLSMLLILLGQPEIQGIGVLMVLFFIITFRQVLQIHSVLKQSIINGLELEKSKDQTERLAKELYRQSTMDALTSVTNRRGFNEALDSEWMRAKRSNTPLTLLMIDVDCFKAFNDSLGHIAGDECLQRIAADLRTRIKRAGETIARYGGEEFAVLLPNTTAEEGVSIADSIRESILKLNVPHPASSVADRVTVSAGVYCVSPDQMEDSKTLLERADQALYQAKADGRNCVRQG